MYVTFSYPLFFKCPTPCGNLIVQHKPSNRSTVCIKKMRNSYENETAAISFLHLIQKISHMPEHQHTRLRLTLTQIYA
jgi:hypothetical protein